LSSCHIALGQQHDTVLSGHLHYSDALRVVNRAGAAL
jgi:predicted DNA-binding protein with PD1-like motif